MAHYLIGYDLHDPMSYPGVAELIERQGGARVLDSLWVISTELHPLELRAALQPAFGPDDGLALVEIRTGSWWACQNAEPEGLAWLRRAILA